MSAMAQPQLTAATSECAQERPQVHVVPSNEPGGSVDGCRHRRTHVGEGRSKSPVARVARNELGEAS